GESTKKYMDYCYNQLPMLLLPKVTVYFINETVGKVDVKLGDPKIFGFNSFDISLENEDILDIGKEYTNEKDEERSKKEISNEEKEDTNNTCNEIIEELIKKWNIEERLFLYKYKNS